MIADVVTKADLKVFLNTMTWRCVVIMGVLGALFFVAMKVH